MGRELLLPQKKGCYNKQKAQQELSIIANLLSCIESFETFIASNEVFDIIANTPILHIASLKTIFNDGLLPSTRYRIIPKN